MRAPAADEALPERLVLTVSRAYTFLMWLAMLAFAALIFYLVHEPRRRLDVVEGWIGILAAGLLLAVLSFWLIRPRAAFIELTREGFRIAGSLSSGPMTPWRDVAKIEVYRASRGGWTRGTGWPHDAVRILYVVLDETKPGTIHDPRLYGYGADELAALMNRFRDGALQANAT